MDDSGLTIGIFGGLGGSGSEVITALEGEGLPIARLVVGSGGGEGAPEVRWRGAELQVTPLDQVALDELDVAICVSGEASSLCPRLLAEDVLTLDLSPGGCGRGVLPAFWPTLNMETLEEHPGGLSLPDPIAAAICEFLAAVHTVGRPGQLTTTVLQGAGQLGQGGIEALSKQTISLLSHRLPERGPLRGTLAFNIMGGSHQATSDGDPYEQIAVADIRSLAPPYLDEIRVSAVQVPIFSGVAASVVVDLNEPHPVLEDLERAVDARAELVRIGIDGTLRDAQEIDHVLVTSLSCEPRGTVRCLLLIDDQHRRASVAAAVLSRIVEGDLW